MALMTLDAKGLDELAYTFTPGRIAFYLRHWGELRALCESPSSARGLLIPGPTPESPKVGARQKGFSGDHHGASNIVADLETAWSLLGNLSIEWYVIWALMRGLSPASFAERTKIDAREVDEAHERAVERMAQILNSPDEGGREPFATVGIKLSSMGMKPQTAVPRRRVGFTVNERAVLEALCELSGEGWSRWTDIAGKIPSNQGKLPEVLSRLASRGLVEVREQAAVASKSRARREYRLTTDGRELVERPKSE